VKTRLLLGALSFLGTLAAAYGDFMPPNPGDRDFVNLGPRSYYRISSSSTRYWDWGLGYAPIEEPERQTHGNGTDVIAVPFNANGTVASTPVYIYTIVPERFEERRIEDLVQGITTKQQVRQILGNVRQVVHLKGYEVWYYTIRVNNPFEQYDSQSGH
jgi:hypothetical protein